MNKKIITKIAIGILLIITAVIGVFFWSKNQNLNQIPEVPDNIGNNAVCTQEAKLCPDGSYVSRTGPNCEFSACPEESIADWKVYQSKRFSIQFSYPEKYILDNSFENTYSDQGFIHLYTQEGYELVKSQAGIGGPDFIQIGAYGNSKKLTALEWAKFDTAHSNFSGEYEAVNIAGENGLSYTFEGMGGLGDVRVIAHNGYIYTFDIMGEAAMQADFKRILDTVKFIE
jgi:hypothetical protein